jgi:hypothetical protein
MKRFCTMAAMLLMAAGVSAQSSSASYPEGNWQTEYAEGNNKYYVIMEIEREQEKNGICGSLSITDVNTDKEVYSADLTYAMRGMQNDVPTGIYYFNVKSDKGRESSIGVKRGNGTNGSGKIIVSATGELKDHPALKQSYNACFPEMIEIPSRNVSSEQELIGRLRRAIASKEEITGYGSNPQLYVNAHSQLNHSKPIYAKPKGTGAINIRKQRDAKSEKIGELPAGKSLLIVDEFDGWCQVKMSEKETGWVSLSVVTLTNTEGTPAIEPTYPPLVDGHVAFMGISLAESPANFKQKLQAKGFKALEQDEFNITLHGQANGAASRVIISKGVVNGKNGCLYSLRVVDQKSYRLPQAKTRFRQLVQKIEAVYGKGTSGDYDDENTQNRKVKVGNGLVTVSMFNEDEMDGASDFYTIAVAYQDFPE